MFYNCENLEDVILSKSCPNLIESAKMFWKCSSLKSYTFPRMPVVQDISYICKECSNLKSVIFNELPDTTTVSSDMFESADNLDSLIIKF